MLLLTILKVIGLVLLAVFLLLLVLVGIVLLVPIRYRLSGHRTETEYGAAAELSFLLHLFSARAVYDPDGLRYSLRILWIRRPREESPGRSETKEKDTSDERKPEDTPPEVREEAPADAERSPAEHRSGQMTEEQQVPEPEAEEKLLREPEQPTEEKYEQKPEEAQMQKAEAPESEPPVEKPESEPEAPGPRKRKQRTGKLRKYRTAALGRIRHICTRLSGWRSMIGDEENQKALAIMISCTKNLLHHLRPRKLCGELTIGSEDPELMGRMLGGLSLFYPLYSEDVILRPQFDRTVFYGELQAKGHFRLIHPVISLLRILMNRKLRHIIFEHL